MVFYVLLAMNPAFAASDDDIDGLRSSLGREWILTKNDRLRNIKTYVRLEDGKQFRSFKVEAVLESSMQTLSNVLFDFENYTKWYIKHHKACLTVMSFYRVLLNRKARQNAH